MKSAASFRLQQNEVYHRMINILQPSSLVEGQGTILYYSYPVVDGDKTNAENSSKIVTERNNAYGSRTTLCEEVLETNYTQIITDYETGKGLQSENHCQQAKPTSDKWQRSQDSLEYNKAYDVVSSQNNIMYESLNTVSDAGIANHDY